MGSNFGFRKIFKWDEPNMKLLNDTLKVLWDKLLGNVDYKDFSSGAKKIIDSKASQTAVDEVTGKVTTLSTEVAQTQEEILLRATKEDLDKVQAELTVTAGEIRSEVSDTASGLQSQIDQQAGEISLRVTGDQLAAGLDSKLDADAPSVGVVAGSTVRITKDDVDITTPKFDVNILGDDGATTALSMTPDGAAFSSLQAPNVMPRYDGPTVLYVNPDYSASFIATYSDRLRSLNDAFSKLSGKIVDRKITIYLDHSSTEYGNATLLGTVFLQDLEVRSWDTTNHPAISGGISIEKCSGRIVMYSFDVLSGSGSNGIYIDGPSAILELSDVVLKGSGNSIGIFAKHGAKAYIDGCQIYNYERSVWGETMTYMLVRYCKGNCILGTSSGILSLSGTIPCNQTSVTYYQWSGGVVFEDIVSVDQGTSSSAPTPTTTTTAMYLAISTGSYKGSGSSYRTEVGQGWYDGIGRVRGCMWFDNSAIRSALSGKTVLSASLRLSMRKGVGRGASVTVELCGTAANSGASSAAVTKNYGVIGTTSPGDVTTITIPNEALTDLNNGTINGLMLYSSDTGAYKDRSYSKNYAMFDGYDTDDSLKPMLTITYQG